MAGPDMSSAMSISQLHLQSELSGKGHGGMGSILDILGKIGAPNGMVGAPVSAISSFGESAPQLCNILRMLLTISGGLGRAIIQSIMSFVKGSSSRLAGIVAPMIGGSFGGRGGMEM